jgi:hypothetical protein
MPIRRPLSPGRGWTEVSLYRAYADIAQEHLINKCYFEAIVICSVGFDVLVNALPDRIRVHHYDTLTPQQQQAIGRIEASDRLTAGGVLKKLTEADILHWRLDRVLTGFNRERNNVIHPIEKQTRVDPAGNTSYSLSLKPGAIIPHTATEEDAKRYYRYFCHIIDLSGGESPRQAEKVRRVYSLSKALQRSKEKRRWRA